MDTFAPNGAGEQYELVLTSRSSVVRAVVSQVGASPRVLTVDGVDLIERYPADRPPPRAAGVVLMPWPNRVDGGRWRLADTDQQLEITEPELGHAIHGLLAAASYEVIARDTASLTLGTSVEPAPGYPFRLDTRVTYEVTSDGLRVRHDVFNEGAATAPVAFGTHPYLRIGDVATEDLVVTLPAARALALDERHIPAGDFPVDGTNMDLRAGVRVRDVVRHASFGVLEAKNGRITHALTAPDGRVLELVAAPDFGYVHFYVTNDFPGEDGLRTAVAIEPMTAPPNALRSGEGLRWLAPGETWTTRWSLRLRTP